MNEYWGKRTDVPGSRVDDDDRQRAITLLRHAVGRGAIGLDELEDRIGAVYEATTTSDLDRLTADLPAPPEPPAPPRPSSHRRALVMEDEEFRGHFTVYALVIGMLVGIWLLSGGGYFWPFYPAAGWGIGLGAHYQRAITCQRRRLARARSLGISLAELEVREQEEARARRSRRPPSPPAPPGMPASASPRANGASTAAREPTHRFVVAMFVDVVGSTGLTEALGDDGWMRVRERLRALLRECFEREGGWEVNTAGDGVLARFEHPNAAACAAVEILRRLDRQRDDSGFAPSVRIGIHSGDVVEEGDGDLIGSVVNVASRVTASAESDEIMVTEHVADHLDPSLHTEDRGIHSLRGLNRPRHLLALRWR